MVSPFTLGLFAPLPLAMMIPFMATQSLAMGEAFGKSFQYGKRKISSMTNDEFNKLTFNDLMDQQTANIKSIIPKLHEQMTDSYQMQEDIFREMTKLLPAALAALQKELDLITKGSQEQFGGPQTLPGGLGTIHPPDITQATAEASPTTIVNVSHGGESTLETPTKSHTVSTGQDDRITFRNKIANYTEFSLNQLLKTVTSAMQRSEIEKRALQIRGSTKTDIPIPEQKPLTTQQSAQKEYLRKTIEFQQRIITQKAKIAKLPGALTNFATKNALKGLANIQTEFRNYITQSRNNIKLKSVANRDWNDRIWKL